MKRTLGRQGEDLAADYLQRQGYTIVERNFRCREGELDIICTTPQELVFVEVKTRRSLVFGAPEESVTLKKRAKIRQVALCWLRQTERYAQSMRFDVISILWQGDEPEIYHIINAF